MAFPTQNDLEESDLDLILSGSEQAILMIEGFAREMPEDDMLAALQFGHDSRSAKSARCSGSCIEKLGIRRPAFVRASHAELWAACENERIDEFHAVKQTPGKQARAEAVAALKERIEDEFIPDPAAPRRAGSGWRSTKLGTIWNRAWCGI